MLYDGSNPNSPFWLFLSYGRSGRQLTIQQECRIGRSTDGSYGGAGAWE